MKLGDVAAYAGRLKDEIARVIIGKDTEIELLLSALLGGGHVLLEDVPGTGKTVLARALARLLGVEFARVQCTPDLLPQDITGSSVYDPSKAEFIFKRGPAFTGILLADELNRATPRTQSALLECMEERQISFGGHTYPLSASFFVIATQNPVEIQGTFLLPEAQLDRFLARLRLGYPTNGECVALLSRFADENPMDRLAPVTNEAELQQVQALVRQVSASEVVRKYIVALAEQTRAMPYIQLGVSTRGMLAMQKAAKARAAMSGRDFVTPDDVKALAVPVFAHRLMARGSLPKSDLQRQAVEDALKAVAVPVE